MKNTNKPIAIFIGLIVAASLFYIGFQSVQNKNTGSNKSISEEENRFINATRDIKELHTQEKTEPVSFESPKVDLIFKTASKKYEFNSISLFKLAINSSKKETIITNGNLAKQLVEKVAKNNGIEGATAAKVIKLKRGGLKRIMRGQDGVAIDKEKTLNSLIQEIKLTPKAATFTVDVTYVRAKSPEDYEAVKKKLGFSTLLAEFDTLHKLHIDDKGRNTNLKVAAEKIDGLIIPPKKSFSFNKIVGPRTKKHGFKNAGVISRGRVIPGLGGGICQVSTTLYKAVLMSNLKIKERHNHSIYDGIEYAKKGLDSAIAWGYKDLRFKNTLTTPILITCKSGKGSVHVEIYGKAKTFDKVVLETRNILKHPYHVKTRVNKKLKKGTNRIVQPGVTGYSVETYRIVTINGKSKEEKLSKDRYLTYNEIKEINN